MPTSARHIRGVYYGNDRYNDQELALSKESGKVCQGIAYQQLGGYPPRPGSKTASFALFREPHHTDADIAAAKTALCRDGGKVECWKVAGEPGPIEIRKAEGQIQVRYPLGDRVAHCVSVGEEEGIFVLENGAVVFWTVGRHGFTPGCKGYHKPGNSLAQNTAEATALDPALGDNLDHAQMHYVDRWSEVPEAALLADPNTAVWPGFTVVDETDEEPANYPPTPDQIAKHMDN